MADWRNFTQNRAYPRIQAIELCLRQRLNRPRCSCSILFLFRKLYVLGRMIVSVDSCVTKRPTEARYTTRHKCRSQRRSDRRHEMIKGILAKETTDGQTGTPESTQGAPVSTLGPTSIYRARHLLGSPTVHLATLHHPLQLTTERAIAQRARCGCARVMRLCL